jgi:hypothetical protein
MRSCARRYNKVLSSRADAATLGHPPRPRPGAVDAPLAFSYVNRFCMGLVYGRAGRLTAKNGGFRPRRAGGDSAAAGGAESARSGAAPRGTTAAAGVGGRTPTGAGGRKPIGIGRRRRGAMTTRHRTAISWRMLGVATMYSRYTSPWQSTIAEHQSDRWLPENRP